MQKELSYHQVNYSEENLSEKVFIFKNKEDKQTYLDIRVGGKWVLYAGTSPETINREKAILKGNTTGIFPLNVAYDIRFYYLFITERGATILAEKSLPLEGAYNFRDLGGLKTENNRFIKWGHLFRAGDLSTLTEWDINYLKHLGIQTLVDLRTDEEVNASPNVDLSFLKSIRLPITPGNLGVSSLENLLHKQSNELKSFMTELYKSLVTEEENTSQYRNLFQLLQKQDNSPLVYHCSAGKDRTGMATALILYSLGVSEDIIFQDYMHSNVFLKDKYAKFSKEHPNLTSLFTVTPILLKSGFDAMKKKYGSVNLFIENTLNVDTEKMKELYLF